MNLASILAMIFTLAPKVVLAVETVHGQAVSGATKSQMATTALNAAVDGATSTLSGTNAQYAQVAGGLIQTAIDASVALTKSTGAYQAASAAAAASQTAAAANPSSQAMPVTNA